MGSFGIVVDAPLLDSLPGFLQAGEPFLIQALLAKAPVERFNLSILRRFSWFDKEQGNRVLLGPEIECLSPKLRPVVDAEPLRCTAQFNLLIQHAHHAFAAQAGVSL